MNYEVAMYLPNGQRIQIIFKEGINFEENPIKSADFAYFPDGTIQTLDGEAGQHTEVKTETPADVQTETPADVKTE